MLNLTVNNRNIEAEEGDTLLSALRRNGIQVPTLCEVKGLPAVGACRICVVEIEGSQKLVASCSATVSAGMKIQTHSPRVIKARKTIVELLLANHPDDCLYCVKSGSCELQALAESLMIRERRYADIKKVQFPDMSSPGIIRDPFKCILCGRCVANCGSIAVNEVLDFGARGAKTRIICDTDLPMGQSSCVLCGACVEACPVGALVFKEQMNCAPQDLRKTRVTCPYCGVGCQIDMHHKDGKFIYSMATRDSVEKQPNQGMLCVKGRFGLDFLNHPGRIHAPMIRKDGKLEEVSWDEALDYTAAKLTRIKAENGPDAIGFLSSAKCTNEDNYALMRLAREVIGTNHIDHCARLCHSSTVAGLAATLGSGAMTNSMAEVKSAKVIFVIGSNPTWNHPVFASLLKQAVRNHGAKLIVCDPRRIDLVNFADIWLQQKNGSDVALLAGLQHIILREGWENAEYIRERTEGFDEYRRSIEWFTPEKVEELTGVLREQLFDAAKLFASGGRAALYYCMGITQHSHGVDNVKACANLSLITGNIGFEGGGINPLRGQSNVQGACDMGCLPNVFTGYQPVTAEEVRNKFSAYWGCGELPAQVGLTATQMIPAAGQRIKALYIMGENPLVSDPDLNHTEKCLKKLDLLVVQDIFLTETAKTADVVFPAAAFAEKSGTVTNTERRVQISNKAFDPPQGARQDYEIIADLAKRLGAKRFPSTVESLWKEIIALTPSYAGMTWDRLRDIGLQWPCPTKDHPGTAFLHKDKFVRGKALLTAMHYKASAEKPDDLFPIRLSTGRMLQHFHTGSMTRRAKVLDNLVPFGQVEINPVDAAGYGVKTGDKVRVTTRRGSIVTFANVVDRVSAGTAFVPFHFEEAAANRLTNNALDPIAAIPEFKVCAARIERATDMDGAAENALYAH